MSDLEKILTFLEHRAYSLSNWALAYEFSVFSSEDEAEGKKRADILRAQSRIVSDLAEEIGRATICEAERTSGGEPYRDSRRVILSEMTGPMDAVVLADASIEAIHGYAVKDHDMLHECGQGRVELSWAEVPPAEAPATGASFPYVDMRYALVMYQDGGFAASIHNTRIEAQAAEKEWSEWNNAGVIDFNNSIALCTITPVLIPQRSS